MLQYTNQSPDGNTDNARHVYRPAPKDATSAVHEYRLDWTPEATRYYVDGEHQKTMTRNVPSVSAPWVMNNWVNGDPYWTAGPPKTDAVLRIKKVCCPFPN
jgi:beta-glucanase (GH16 family)